MNSIKFLGIILDSKLSWNHPGEWPHTISNNESVQKYGNIVQSKTYFEPENIVYFILFFGITIFKLELVYLPVGKYCVYPRMVYRQAIA